MLSTLYHQRAVLDELISLLECYARLAQCEPPDADFRPVALAVS